MHGRDGEGDGLLLEEGGGGGGAASVRAALGARGGGGEEEEAEALEQGGLVVAVLRGDAVPLQQLAELEGRERLVLFIYWCVSVWLMLGLLLDKT